MDSRFGSLAGVIRTRVGYTGGTRKNPTYRSMKGHTETVEMEYDPDRIDYKALLDQFWKGHDPTRKTGSRQYMSAIFYHDNEQKALALEGKQIEEKKRGRKIHTKILPAGQFYRAEDYHQKYMMRQSKTIMDLFKGYYPAPDDFTDSPAAAKINGYLGGFGESEPLETRIKDFGLSHPAEAELKERFKRLVN